MLIKTNFEAIFKITGSISALCDEKAWEQLLRGEVVGVWEPDAERWSLLADGQHLTTFRAINLADALATVKRDMPRASSFVWEPSGSGKWRRYEPVSLTSAPTEAAAYDRDTNTTWMVSMGYPNALTVSPEQRQKHYLAGRTDAKKIADWYRSLVRAGMNAAMIAEEVEKHGMTREGRD
jgi:hypothetical protein